MEMVFTILQPSWFLLGLLLGLILLLWVINLLCGWLQAMFKLMVHLILGRNWAQFFDSCYTHFCQTRSGRLCWRNRLSDRKCIRTFARVWSGWKGHSHYGQLWRWRGGGYASVGGAGSGSSGGLTYGNIFLLPLIGGSGGGGGGGVADGAGGGGGGGALLIASSSNIIIDGSIDAKGGAGGSGLGSGNSSQRGGGGGSGGSIRLLASVISGSGALSVYRGIGSNGGGSGSDGRIRLEAFDHNFTVGTNPGYTYSSPSVVFLPTNNIVPSVRVVSVDGQLVPANPTGSFGPADLDITNAAPVTLDIVTENIPTGATVTVTMWSENGGSTNFTSSPLMGTDQSSTGTVPVPVPVPFGFSRFYIDAYWAN